MGKGSLLKGVGEKCEVEIGLKKNHMMATDYFGVELQVMKVGNEQKKEAGRHLR